MAQCWLTSFFRIKNFSCGGRSMMRETLSNPQITAYHGTSSVFLRSIFENGLVPRPANVVWKKHVSPWARSSGTIGGVYVASKMRAAFDYAITAVGEYGGVPV